MTPTESILETIASYGIRTLQPVESPGDAGVTLTIDGTPRTYDAGESSVALRAHPHHEGNTGFIHLVGDDFSALLLKGVFKDFIRLITGTLPVSERVVADAASVCTSVERMHPEMLNLTLLVVNDVVNVVHAEPAALARNPHIDMRRLDEPERPLTSVEYSMISNDLAPESTLFSRGPFTEYFPETLSHFTANTAKRMPNIINPVFSAVSIKTHMPSISVMANRLYLNVTNFESIGRSLDANNAFFLHSHAPAVARKLDTRKTKPPRLRLLPVDHDDVSTVADEFSSSVDDITIDTIDKEALTTSIGLGVTAATATYLKLWQNAARLMMRAKGDEDVVLKAMYATRDDSLFRTGRNMSLPRFLDPAEPVETFTFSPWAETEDISDALKRFGLTNRMFHGRSIAGTIRDIHRWLTIRDRLYLTAAELTLKLRTILLAFGEDLVNKNYIKKPEQVFWFENEEIGELRDDEYLGNIPFTVNFRHWQDQRLRAQMMPPELFERDAPDVDEVVGRMRDRIRTTDAFAARSHFHRPVEGNVIRLDRVSDESNAIVAARGFSLPLLGRMNAPAALVVESASPLGHTAEFCAIHDVPLHDGIRFAPLVLDGKAVTLGANHITLKPDGA